MGYHLDKQGNSNRCVDIDECRYYRVIINFSFISSFEDNYSKLTNVCRISSRAVTIPTARTHLDPISVTVNQVLELADLTAMILMNVLKLLAYAIRNASTCGDLIDVPAI